jgi:uncharacterized protein YaaR (DUF327 family)|tara:strand:- start:362 stop:604 length:243 start_codon:yes stop_codon:yes gene_type:complete
MNRKFVKENKSLVREFVSALIASIVAGKLNKSLEKKLMSKPETKKDIQDLRNMKKDLDSKLDRIRKSDPKTYKMIKSYYK